MTVAEIALIGALDTKAEEYAFLRERVELTGCRTWTVDVGVLGRPGGGCDVSRADVARAAGADLADLAAAGDRAAAVAVMARGAAEVVRARYASGGVQGAVAAGGSNAGVVFAAVAAALPFGVPKVLAATVAAGDTRPYVGTRDVTLLNPVVDVAGLNRLTRVVLADAAAAVTAMATRPPVVTPDDRPLAVVTTFGVTTAGATLVREHLQARGFEVVSVAGNGTGGRALEDLVRDGVVDVLVDLTTTELADDLVGGVCSAGPDRLTAAVAAGVPQVVVPGALDMVNFGPVDTVPKALTGRRLHVHNAGVTLLRTDARENAELGRRMAAKLASATAPTSVLVPGRGFSQLSVEGAPFHDPEADAAFLASLTAGLPLHVTVRVVDTDVNDPTFAAAVVEETLRVRAGPAPASRTTTTSDREARRQ